MTSGRSLKEAEDVYKGQHKEPNRPLDNNFYDKKSLKKISSVYLLDDKNIDDIQNSNNILIGKVGEEINILQKLFCGKDYDFHKLYDVQNREQFSNWNIIRDQILPCTDILIIDRYANQGELLEYNLYKIIELLVENVRSEINIVIVTMSNNTDKNWNNIQNEIKKIVKSKTKNDCHVTIIFRKQETMRLEKDDSKKLPHDRMILTNYKLFRSGDSFCYFDSKGKTITKGKSLDVDSLATNSTFEFAESILQDIQKLYDGIKKINSDFIVGDRKSHFLSLETE